MIGAGAIADLEQQERESVFDTFDHTTAWEFGFRIAERAREA